MPNAEDYDRRYGSGWDEISKLAKELQRNHCAGCGEKFESNELQLHHLVYSANGELLRDRVIPGLHAVAVHGNAKEPGTCHYRLHQKDFYRYDDTDPIGGNHNTEEVIDRMHQNWASLTGINPRQDPRVLLQEISQKAPKNQNAVRIIQNAWIESGASNQIMPTGVIGLNQAVPTTPGQIGSAQPPDKYYNYQGQLINAPVAGDLSPIYEPSPEYQASLDGIRRSLFSGIDRPEQEQDIFQAIKEAAAPWFLIFLFFITLFLVILIGAV